MAQPDTKRNLPTSRPSIRSVPTAAGQIQYLLEAGGLAASSAQTPFWLRTNQFGTVPLRGSLGTLRFGVVRDYRAYPDSASRRQRRFDWGFGINTVLNVGPKPTSRSPAVLLPDAYLKVRFGQLELYGGNRREVIGLGDTVLTSGFVAWSGNALPFPKIQLHTPGFVPLGFTKKLLSLRVGYAHGWLTNTYIRGSYLHHKYLYGRVGKPNWRVRLYGGINHQVQWGGRAAYLVGMPLAINGNLPTSFKEYLSLVTGRYPDAIQNDRFTDFDGTNRVGNHVGTYDLALEWNGRRRNWLLYHQHMYEDASGLALRNIPDGLTGLRFLNGKTNAVRLRLQRFVVEWLNTTNQSGPTFDGTLRYQGSDNYFNHSQYREGWSYRGRTLGTPFIIPRTDFTPLVNNFTGGGFFPDNRVVAWYMAAEGVFKRGTRLTVRSSYSRNLGTFTQPYPKSFNQFSTLLSAQWRFVKQPGITLTTSLALDRGELLPNTAGGYVSLKRYW
jgi:hypothetical protein